MNDSFSNETLYVTFGLMVQRLWGFEDFSPSSGKFSTTINAVESAQICPKTISLRNFEMPPKIEILVFFKNKNFYV
jgi:hypothetical protein